MQSVKVNVPSTATQRRADLEAIAANFEFRAQYLIDHWNKSHATKEPARYDKTLVAYTTWRDAARVLRGIADGSISIEQLRKVSERGQSATT